MKKIFSLFRPKSSSIDSVTLPSEEEIRMRVKYFPVGFSEVRDCIGSLIVRAPDYKNEFHPEYTREITYGSVVIALDKLIINARNEKRREQFRKCREYVLTAHNAFVVGDETAGYPAIQEAYEIMRMLQRKSASTADN